MSESADEVMQRALARAAERPELTEIAGALQEVLEQGRWSEDAIEQALAGLRQGDAGS